MKFIKVPDGRVINLGHVIYFQQVGESETRIFLVDYAMTVQVSAAKLTELIGSMGGADLYIV